MLLESSGFLALKGFLRNAQLARDAVHTILLSLGVLVVGKGGGKKGAQENFLFFGGE